MTAAGRARPNRPPPSRRPRSTASAHHRYEPPAADATTTPSPRGVWAAMSIGIHTISATPAAVTAPSASVAPPIGRPPCITSTVGSAHTQWCDHDTGETTRPNIATHISPSDRLTGPKQPPAAQIGHAEHREASQRPQHEPLALAEAEPRQRARDVLVGVQRRAADPVGVAHGVGPVLHRVPPGEHEPERLATAADAAVTPACGLSRRSTKYSKNTAGVSFSAIATPSSRPRGHGVLRGTQSAIPASSARR